MAKRLTTILALATLALAVTASSGTAAGPVSGRILGVVPHAAQPAPQAPRLAKAIGSAGSAGSAVLTFDAAYQTVINQYFTDVSADSTGLNNVYATDTQYYDNPGPLQIQYQSTFGGSYVDKDPLPANGCDDGVDTYCLTDQQLQAEIQTVLTAKGWHGGLDHIFFLMTPNGVGSCFDAFSGECTTNAFCAYHSFFVDSNSENVIYANEPDMGPPGGCTDPAQGFPNDPDADTTVNTISHEHNEAITDPLTADSSLAWIAADGSENGDLCAYNFGTPLGGTPGIDAYNQQINGHKYDLQLEYSNADRSAPDVGCVDKPGGTPSSTLSGTTGPLVYMGGPVMHTNTTYAIYWLPTARNTSPPVVTGTAALNRTLTTSAGAWAAGGAPFSYQWQRCAANGTSCVDISGATATTYKLTSADGGHVVRSTVRATNANGASQPAASAGTALVVDVPTAVKAPHITGRARVGRKLSGSHGSWTFSPTYRYQWLRCNAYGGSCSRIRKATHSTYRLTKHDARHRLRLRVTAANAAGSKTAISRATARVPAAKR